MEVNRINNITITDIFEQFAKLLENRFIKEVYTTEDSIRYTLFYCLTHYGKIHPSDIILEHPHSHISGAKIDTYIPPQNDRCGLAFEFKFDRKIPSERNSPKTQKAGRVFVDIFRLALFYSNNEKINRYFVYVTDKEMATYFCNQLDDFFNLAQGKILRIDEEYITKNRPNTFVNCVKNFIINCEVISRLRENFLSKIWVRIYEVKPLDIQNRI